MSNQRRQRRALLPRIKSIAHGQIVPHVHRPLKLRREPDDFWTEPRKPSPKVTLPRLKCLEKEFDE